MRTVREVRVYAGLTQAKMSELLGIPKRTIENWETGSRKCPEWAERLVVEKLESIAERGDHDAEI